MAERTGTEVESGEAIRGYEMHIGQTSGPDTARPWLTLADGRAEGAISADGRVMASYLHGVFAADGFRRRFLERLGSQTNGTAYQTAVEQADMVYTDVWVSMGMETEAEDRLAKLAGYQINAEVMRLAKPNALVMHCLPAYRGKEIDEVTFEAHADTIFTQAENRVHTQKAIMSWLAV